MNMLFPRIPLWDPDKFLKMWLPINRLIFSRFGAIVWMAVVFTAIAFLAPFWNQAGHSLQVAAEHSVDIRNNPVNLILLYSVFVLVKFIHELGHAFACRRFGGECHEMGIMFLVFIPTPYVDASTAWAFPNKWHRIFVGAAGMIVELFVAAIAAFIWINTGDIHSVVSQLAFNAMLIASVTTLVFNANPLLRYDGYYILSDYWEIPNLRQKSSEYALGLIKRHIFSVKLQQPLPPPLQRVWLLTYAIFSSIYRAFVGLVILMIVAYEIPVIGPLMAISGIATWFIVPVYKVFKYLAIDPELHRKRPRAIAFSTSLAAALVVLVGFVRFPVNIDAEGVLSVDKADNRPLYAEQPGFVRQIGDTPKGAQVRDGDFVSKGQVLMVLENMPLKARLAEADAQVGQLRAELMQATVTSSVLAKGKALELDKMIEERKLLSDQFDKLTISAPIDGEVIAPDLANRIGSFVGKDNKEVVRVENTAHQYVETVLTQDDYQLLAQQEKGLSAHTEVRMVGEMDKIMKAQSVTLAGVALSDAPSAALTQLGGGEGQLDPTERQKPTYTTPQFRVQVVLDDSGNYVVGQRSYVRFKLAKKPLVWQWGRRFWQLIDAKGASAKWL
jgi:putative peptide zinc metalloprotease protein